MIKLDVIEPSKAQPIKSIYFSDEQGWCFRVSHFLGEKLVLDELKEFSSTKQIVGETLFNRNYEVIAYKNYLKDSSGKIIGTEDFEMIDGQLKKLNSIFFEIINEDNNDMKQRWHNNLELVYTFQTSGEFDFRYVKPNGDVVDSEELHDFLQANKPREFFEIGNEYLNRIVKENT